MHDMENRGGSAVPHDRPALSASWRALAVLFPVGLFNYFDRALIGILQIPMKAELGLTDTQLGILLGAAFGLVYTICGLPAGWLADRFSRKPVLLWALVIWTSLTALTSMAGNFFTVLLCRMGVGVGESACSPVTHSMVSDLFPRDSRSKAVAIWALSLPIGSMAGLLVAGWLQAIIGWRATFAVCGLAGLLIVPLLAFCFREPQRGRWDPVVTDTSPKPSLGALFRLTWQSPAYRYIAIGSAFHLVTLYAAAAWTPQFYARAHGLSTAQIGVVMGLIAGLGGFVGMALTARISEPLVRRDDRWYVWMPAIASALLIPGLAIQLAVPSTAVSIGAGFVCNALLMVFYAPLIAATQSLMPARLRTMTGALYVLIGGVFSTAVGPLMVGAASDALAAYNLDAALVIRLSLAVSMVGTLLSVPFLLLAARTIREEFSNPGHTSKPGVEVPGRAI